MSQQCSESTQGYNMEEAKRVVFRLKTKLSRHSSENLSIDTCLGNAEKNAFHAMGLGLASITVSTDCSREACEAIFKRVMTYHSADINESWDMYDDIEYSKVCYFQTIRTLLFIFDMFGTTKMNARLKLYIESDRSIPKYFVGSAAIDFVHHQHLEIYFAQSARSIPTQRLSRRILRKEVTLPNAPPVIVSSPDSCSVQDGSITGFLSLKTEMHGQGFRQTVDYRNDLLRFRNFFFRWTRNTPNIDCHEGTMSLNIPLIAAYTEQARDCLEIAFETRTIKENFLRRSKD